MIFDSVTPCPPDAILGLTDAFKKDANPKKVNLGVGVYVDDSGKTPVLESVKRAEKLLLDAEKTKSYLPISGSPRYGEAVQRLVFGASHPVIAQNRVHTAHTPGGTGGLRVGAELIKKLTPNATVWLSSPTWPNHKSVFASAGLKTAEYAYYDAKTRGLDFAGMQAALEKVPEKDIVVLHVCCHNPTGVDPSPEQWKALADVAARRRWIPFFDFAYQGFGAGLEQDRAGLLPMLVACPEALVSSSFSKNFGLYNERVGALSVVAGNKGAAEAVFSHMKAVIRTIYSNPPAHGGEIVATVFADPELTALWEKEVAGMRERIARMRKELVACLSKRHAGMDFSFINRQHGMFSFSGLSDAQVAWLREKKSIYMVGGGRMNVAGILPKDLDYLCDSIVEAIAANP